MNPLVSVVIPTYKRSEMLPRAINSVLSQTYKNVDVYIVDDNDPNTDFRRQTEFIMKQFDDNPRVHYLKHECNKNGSAARNTGYRASHGEYIALLDDDDEYLPNKIEDQIKLMESLDNSWGACYTKFTVVDGKKNTAKIGEMKEGNLLVDALSRNLMLAAGSNLMIRRSVMDELNGFDESFVRNQDLELLTRILFKYKLACTKKDGLIIHAHKGFKVDFEAVTDRYKHTFSGFISKLSIDEQKRVYDMINLQLFRYRLFSKKDFLSVMKMYKNNEIKVWTSFRYIIHLADRFITKERKGFKM